MNRALIFFCSCVLFSCSEPEEKSPAPICLIEKDKMIPVLAEMQIAKSWIRLEGKNPDSAENVVKGYYQDIFKRHQITEVCFDSSYEYYGDHPKEMDEMYQGVLEVISKYQAQNEIHKKSLIPVETPKQK